MPTKLDCGELIKDLQRVAEEIGERPTASQYIEHGHYGSVNPFKREFGSWSEGLEAAGFESPGQVADPSKDAELIEVECANCGEQEEVRESQNNNQKRWYCSKDCHNQWMSDNKHGENHPQYNRVTVTCENCATEFKRKPWYDQNRDRHFCSYGCMGTWYSQYKSGENSHNWKTYPELTCENCGADYTVKPANKERSKYCSRECLYDARDFAGERNPNWAGGYEPYYGANWPKKRRERLELDNFECVVCGMSQKEHIETHSSGLHVHHVRPHREFEESKSANRLDNLRTMCTTHHKEWEGVPVAPD